MNKISLYILIAASLLSNLYADSGSWVRMGIIVSSRTGLANDKTLSYSYEDGSRVYNVLKNIGKIPEQNLFLIQDEDTKVIRDRLSEISGIIQGIKNEGHKVFLQFYYSGHGAHRHFHVGRERIAFNEIKKLLNLNKVDARVIVLDVCYGASFFAAKGFKTAPPVPVELHVDDLTKGEVVITSSAMNEQSYEVEPLEGSIFTSHWLMALRGAGDKNKDGQVSLFEAYNYSYHKTVAYSEETLNRPQHPSYDMQLQGGRDLMLTRLQELSTGLLFQDCPQGNYSVTEMNRGLNIGEVYLPGDGNFSLALEPGRYEIKHLPSDAGPKGVKVKLSTENLTTLPWTNFKPITKKSATVKGNILDSPKDDVNTKKPHSHTLWNKPLRIEASFSFGGQISEDLDLLQSLKPKSPVEKYFKLKNNYIYEELSFYDALAISANVANKLRIGVRFAFSKTEIASKAAGQEPLNSTETIIPVTLEKSYTFSHQALGPFLEVTPLEYRGNRFGIDLSWQYLKASLSTDWKLKRILYDDVMTRKADFTGTGNRYEAGLVYVRNFFRLSSRFQASLRFNVGTFYQTFALDIAGPSDVTSNEVTSHETGILTAASLSISTPNINFWDKK